MMIVALEQAGGPAHFIMPQMKGRVGEQGTGWDIVMIAMGMWYYALCWDDDFKMPGFLDYLGKEYDDMILRWRNYEESVF